jgi:hypothetical protein
MRALLLFVIGLAFGAAGGFIGAGGMGPSSHDHAGHSDAGHDHSAMLAWDGPVPTLDLSLTPDGSGVNLMIDVTGFRFAPAAVNGPATPGEGHAHIYVNGEKVRRIYAPFAHLEMVQPGDVIRVTLNANSHEGYMGTDGPLVAEITAP